MSLIQNSGTDISRVCLMSSVFNIHFFLLDEGDDRSLISTLYMTQLENNRFIKIIHLMMCNDCYINPNRTKTNMYITYVIR